MSVLSSVFLMINNKYIQQVFLPVELNFIFEKLFKEIKTLVFLL